MPSLQVYNSRGIKYVRIVESYRDPVTKKPKVKVLKNLGRADVLEAEKPGYIEELKLELQESRELNAKVKQEAIFDDLHNLLKSTNDAEAEGFPIKNYGVTVYADIWKELKLDYFFDYRQKQNSKIRFKLKDVVSSLVYSRLLDPGSKKKNFENKDQFINQTEFQLEHVYRSLGFLDSQKDNLEKYLNKRLAEQMTRNLAVAFYDVTTYYFESVEADELKNFGYSKDNKVNQVQVVMGLLIDNHGIPISYELFPGNTNDFKTLIPVMLKLKQNYGINKMIITADRGLNSKQNLAMLKSLGFEYIMAYKIRSSSKSVKDMVLDDAGYVCNDPSFKWKVCSYENSVKVDGDKVVFNDNMVITWSAERAEKDKRDRERLVKKSKRLVESKSNFKAEMKKGGKKYIQLSLMDEDWITFDEKQVEMDEQFDGYYAIQASDRTLPPQKVIDIYHSLWKIEASFRVLKSNFEARPIFVWTESSIRGHFAICYLALVIQRYLEYKLQQKSLHLSTERIQEALRTANLTLITRPGEDDYFIKNRANDDYDLIKESLNLPNLPQYGKLKDLR